MKIMLIALTTVCALFATTPALAQFNFNKLLDAAKKSAEAAKKVSEASREFTDEEEVAIGDDMAASLLGAAPLHPDENLQRYVNRVGRWVASQSDRPDLPWVFGVLNSPAINAFAAPGGRVFVSLGLIYQLHSEAELAGVLAHEIGHVVKRHHVKAIRANAKAELGKMMLSEVAQNSRANGLAKEGVKQLASTGMTLIAKGLDKSDEFEADRMGIVLAARAGYESYGLINVVQSLAALKPEESGLSLMMSTHPNPSSRIAEFEHHLDLIDRYANQPQVKDRFIKTMITALR